MCEMYISQGFKKAVSEKIFEIIYRKIVSNNN